MNILKLIPEKLNCNLSDQPVLKNEILPVILYVHGGGWILGDSETHGALIKNSSKLYSFLRCVC